MKIKAKDVRIGDEIIIDPRPTSPLKDTTYVFFDNKKIIVEEITTLPGGAFYFIYGGDQRASLFVPSDQRIEINLTSILRKL